jgi:quercetin dioxygenase-like cupin family protein
VAEQVIHRRDTILVRRLCLAPGEATPWHRDPYHRVTVILGGEALAIEYRDGRPRQRIEITAGQVDWDEPFEDLHRAINVGLLPYEEITVFFLDRPDAVPQPEEA